MNQHKDDANVVWGDFPKHGGGNGGGEDMADRLDRLEKKVDPMESNFSRLSDTMIRIEGRFDMVDHKFETVLGKLEDANKGFSEKLDNAVSLTGAKINTSAAETKLSIILAIPAIIGVGMAIYKAIAYFSHTPS